MSETPLRSDGPTPAHSAATLGMRVVESRVHARLFGAASHSVSIGRFTVLGALGAGGMGVVFAAHDPELDRKVAIKLVAIDRCGSSSSSQARLLTEAQTMARLSHPNVVSVHEVGAYEGGVYIAMEHIDGETLDQWLARTKPSWSQILAVFEQAGQGLAAAHRHGVVHRDFKPSNTMIDRTGRVRVLDFGLAIGRDPSALESTEGSDRGHSAHSLGGTFIYMSPEQRAGAPASVRSDEYAFCVSLWSALFGEHPFARDQGEAMVDAMANGILLGPHTNAAPAWIAGVLRRGLAPDPTRRWRSMEALLVALHRARSGAGRRRVLTGLAVATVATVSIAGVRALDRGSRSAACDREGASIRDVWNDDARAAARTGVLATELSYAESTAREVMPWIDAQADAWQHARTEACLDAEVRGIWDADTLDRSSWCLDEAQMELDTLARDLARADGDVVRSAVSVATGLRPIAACRDADELRRLAPPPSEHREALRAVRAELVRGQALSGAGKFPRALAVVDDAVVRAGDLEWPPLFAAAKLAQAGALDQLDRHADAEEAALVAYFTAADVGAWDIAAAAASRSAYVVGVRRARHAEALEWIRHAEIATAHAGDPLRLREAVWRNAAANVYIEMNDLTRARAAYESVLQIETAAYDVDHPQLAGVIDNLAVLNEKAGDIDGAIELHERALAIEEAAFGPDHPRVAGTLVNLGNTLLSAGQAPRARSIHERALEIRERAFGPASPTVAKSLSNLALVLSSIGDLRRARALHERAVAVFEAARGRDHRDVGMALVNLGVVEYTAGEHDYAKAHFERALAILEPVYGGEHPMIATLVNNLGAIELERGDFAAARTMHERALAIRMKVLGPEHGDVGSSLGNLGLALGRLGEYTQGVGLLERALALKAKSTGVHHPQYAQALANLGEVHLAMGDESALEELERALAIFDENEGVQDGEPDARFLLAKAIVASKGDEARARAVAETAREGFRSFGEGRAQAVALIDAWLAEHRNTAGTKR